MAAAYDPNNIFSKILRGEVPCNKVFEDDVALAFMDIMPRAEGHVLVIPKEPARGLLDADPKDLAALIVRVQHVAAATQKAFKAEGLTIQQFNESAGGQMVFHLHFHVLPRWDGVPLRPPGTMGDSEKLKAQAEKIRAELQNSVVPASS
jgi:histidine triad (HIT) family protein